MPATGPMRNGRQNGSDGAGKDQQNAEAAVDPGRDDHQQGQEEYVRKQ